MVYLPVLAVAIAVSLALGGKLGNLAGIRLRGIGLFYLAIGIQIVAFPPAFLPWTTPDAVARWLWLGSYACLFCGASLNLRLRGVWLVALGMLSNVVAVVANGGVMPSLPTAAQAAGIVEPATYNSVTTDDPRLAWLVDRWAAPDWIPLANVFSVGDVLLALGAFVLVLAATDVPLLRRLRLPGRRIATI
jgi:hypothetical protein